MKHMVIPLTICTVFVILFMLGRPLTHYHAAPANATQVAQAVQATLTAWPTPKPPDRKAPRRVASPATATPTPPPRTTTPADLSEPLELERAVLRLINQQRQARGLPSLTLAAELTAAARRHSRDMATQAKPQHRGSDGSSAAQRIQATGYPATHTSETIGWGIADPAEMVQWFMDDDLHRDVLLSDQFRELGVGYVTQVDSPWRHYWTVAFGRRAEERGQPVIELPQEPASAPQPIVMLDFDRPEESILLDPLVDGCPSVSERHYATIPMTGVDETHPDFAHGDLNLALRGYTTSDAAAHLIDLAGPTDSDAPQLPRLFADGRTPAFTAAYQVYAWDWGCGGDGCRGDRLTEPAVTLLGLATTPGELIYPPQRNAEIYGGGYVAVVLYADATRLTLAYTRDGTLAHGYAVQLENLCVDPNLLQAYRVANAAGRDELPALHRGEVVGVTAGSELLVATRDRGAFLDPRSRKDWWR